MTRNQVEKLARMFEDALKYADKHEICVEITRDAIYIDNLVAVDLPTIYTIVKAETPTPNRI